MSSAESSLASISSRRGAQNKVEVDVEAARWYISGVIELSGAVWAKYRSWGRDGAEELKRVDRVAR